MKSKKSKDKLKADKNLDTSAESESPKGIEKFKLKTKKDFKKPKKESKTSLKSVDSNTSNLSSNATFADRSMAETTVNVSAISTSPSFTKTYDYTEDEHSATKKHKPIGGFTYETNVQKTKESVSEIPTSPSKRAQGLAFNYAPGEAKKVAETAAEKRKTFMEKIADGIKTPGINYVQSAAQKETSIKKEPPTETKKNFKANIETKIEPKTNIGMKTETLISVETKKEPKTGVETKNKIKLSPETKKEPKSSDLESNKDSKFGAEIQKESKPSDEIKKETKSGIETKIAPVGEVAFTKTVLEKKVTSASAETTVETEKKKVDPKFGIFNKKSKEPNNKGVLEKAMDKLGSFGKGSKDKTEVVDVKKESSDFIEHEQKSYEEDKPLGTGTTPLIVKTTTKQTMIKDKEGVTQNIEEKVEDLTSGEITVSTHHNKVIVV